jgi:hypothetical protein
VYANDCPSVLATLFLKIGSPTRLEVAQGQFPSSSVRQLLRCGDRKSASFFSTSGSNILPYIHSTQKTSNPFARQGLHDIEGLSYILSAGRQFALSTLSPEKYQHYLLRVIQYRLNNTNNPGQATLAYATPVLQPIQPAWTTV